MLREDPGGVAFDFQSNVGNTERPPVDSGRCGCSNSTPIREKTRCGWDKVTINTNRCAIGPSFRRVGPSAGFPPSPSTAGTGSTSTAEASTPWWSSTGTETSSPPGARTCSNNAHGLRIDAEDNLYCTEWRSHCVHKLTSDGELQWTLGTPGVPRPPGLPFNLPTDLAIAPDGCLFVSDGYGNAKVHKFSPDGVLLKSWGEPGTGPGQFDLVHDVWVDSDYLVYVCDRSNNRIQIFDGDGNYLREWTDLLQPDFVWFDPDETVFVSEIEHRVSVLSRDGRLLSRWGEKGDGPGQFPGFPHAIWGDSRGDLYIGEVGVNGSLTKFVRV